MSAQPRWRQNVIRSVYLSIAPEFLGTALLAFLGGAIVAVTGLKSISDGAVTVERSLVIALTDGFLFYGLVYLTMKLSNQTSGYLNPYVPSRTVSSPTLPSHCLCPLVRCPTLTCRLDSHPHSLRRAFSIGLCIVNMYAHASRWHIIRALAYVAAQIAGALVGVAMILAMVPNALESNDKTGVPALLFDESAAAAFGLTTTLSVFLMFVILSVRNNEGRMTSLLLCFAYMAARLLTQPLCGGYLNPARTLAHAVVGGGDRGWRLLWIDMVGSVLGSVIAGVFYLVWVRKWRE